jgi:serine protease Do
MSKKVLFLTTVMVLLNADPNTGIQDAKGFEDRVMPHNKMDVALSFNDAIKDAKKGVVNISTTRKVKNNRMANPFLNDPFFRQFFGQNYGGTIPRERVERSLGSGVIISKDGYILTNNHVIDGADEILVTLPGEQNEFRAKLVGTDSKSDLAVIRITAKDLQNVKFADSSKIKVGDVVFAIGNPFGVGESVTWGIISALNKSGMGINEYEDFIQTDASINPGNSGGALIDSRGNLVGINTAIISKTGQNNGIGFAIPANMAKKIATDLILKGKIDRGYLGININDLPKDLRASYGVNYGSIILNADKNGSAYKAGLRRGDLIIGVNGRKIRNSADLKNEIGNKSPDDEIRIDIIRNGQRKAYKLKLGRLSLLNSPMSDARTFEGLLLEKLTPRERRENRLEADTEGVVVAKVEADSKAERDGFLPGDIIMQVEDIVIADLNDLKRAYKIYKKRAKRVYITRQGYMKILVVK